ncbi:MAG: hypothetical protein QN174_10025 [Armatimonadota bacterium]|nr:hypothetical protein [Armatimonadota bacterium]MDR7457217.1 hypothetical protein [Armatimonadota bacterium]MDR7497280.1 hypothetical protein [Armatimonadota bacterium]MDR7511146.1 hypothetical protein [Armatimonadota bacterium]
MDRSLLPGVLALAAAGWACGALLARGGGPPSPRRALPTAVAVAALALIAVATLPGRAVWKDAEAWGPGAVAGGIAALLAGWPALGTPRHGLGRAGAVVSALFPATGAAAALLWLRPGTADAMAGAAAGWVLATALLALALDRPRDPTSGSDGTALLAAGTGFAVTVFAAMAMGGYRDAAASADFRWTAAILLIAAAVPVLALLAALPASSRGRSVVRAVAASALLAALAALVGDRVLAQPRFAQVALVGAATPLLAWWLHAEGAVTPDDRGGVPLHAALAALVVLAGTVAAFYLLIGYGVGAMLVAAWLPATVLVASVRDERAGDERAGDERAGDQRSGADAAGRAVTTLLTFGAVVLLYRLYLERFQGQLSGAVLTDHFAIFSLIAGAVSPALLAGALAPRDGRTSPARALVRLFFALVLALALPAMLLALWGPRAAIGLLAGLMVGIVMAPGNVAAAVAALVVAVPLLQWSPAALAVSGLPRAEKVRFVLWIAGIALAALVATDIGARLITLGRGTRRAAAPAGEGAP